MQLRKLSDLPGNQRGDKRAVLSWNAGKKDHSADASGDGNHRAHGGLRRVVALLAVALVAVALTVVGLYKPTQTTASGTDQDIVVSGTIVWQYRDDSQAPADGWKTSAATTDTAWKQGTGSFGAKNGKIADLGDGYPPRCC
ncbi:MAG: hypothetical protein PUD09_06665 [Coriobacteriales bacterium]|nr:hypothetical protein [Coriobacteriales bacterium]